MDRKNMKLYVRNKLYFIVDQYQKDTCFYEEDAYYHYDIGVDRILLHKRSDNKYFIRYRHSNRMDILPLQLKLKNFYFEIHDYNKGGRIIYIENSDDEFFQTIREIWNKITKLIGINNAPNFVQNNLFDEQYIRANILRNKSFVKSNCLIVLHSVVNNNLKASLLELINYTELSYQ